VEEYGGILLGIFGLKDNLQQNTIRQIRKLKQAGMQIVIMTGCNPNTAESIAKNCGIID